MSGPSVPPEPSRSRSMPVARTARWFQAGEASPAVRDLWIVLHGYGQLASFFVRHFEGLASAERLIVAPEALNRFYLEPPSVAVAQRTVGASWMTREERDADIADYVAYLDALYAKIVAECGGVPPRVTVLGFSQGTATACRWVERGTVRPARLILWAGEVPGDYDFATRGDRLRDAKLTLVLGSDDEYVKEPMVAVVTKRLDAAAVPYRMVRYEGGHRIHRATLAALAAEGATADAPDGNASPR